MSDLASSIASSTDAPSTATWRADRNAAFSAKDSIIITNPNSKNANRTNIKTDTEIANSTAVAPRRWSRFFLRIMARANWLEVGSVVFFKHRDFTNDRLTFDVFVERQWHPQI